MKRTTNIVLAFIFVYLLTQCGGSGSSSSSSSSSSSGGGGGSTYAPHIAEDVADSLPSAMKTGGSVSSNIAVTNKRSVFKGEGTIDVPWGDSSGEGNDPFVGDILWLFWNLDYTNETTDATIASGQCFRVRPSTYPDSGDTWMGYCKPTVLIDPTKCINGPYADISGSSTSILQRACLFDYNMNTQGSSIDSCYDSTGTTVDISEYIPWYASWGLSQNYLFQGSVASGEEWGYWFKVNQTTGGDTGQHVMTLYNSSTLKGMNFTRIDTDSNRVIFIDINNYNATVQNIGAYIGTLPDATTGQTTGAFEALHWLDYHDTGQGDNSRGVMRMKSDGTYIWTQSFHSVPGADAGFNASSPDESRCAKLVTNLPSSMYVDNQYCLTAFNKASTTELNTDSWYTLQLSASALQSTNWYDQGDTWYSATGNPPVEPLGECYPATTP